MAEKIAKATGKGWGAAFKISLAAALMTPVVAMSPAATALPPRAQASLLQLAAQHPDAKVRVIVQKSGQGSNVEAEVVKLGGTVTKDLHIINAFAAELPASAAGKLSTQKAINWVSMDAQVVSTGDGAVPPPPPGTIISSTNLKGVYPKSVRATDVWNKAPYLQGTGIGVAVVDTGIMGAHPDLLDATGHSRVVANVAFGPSANVLDTYGHGTHVAGIIGGNGAASNGAYMGVAPKVNLVNVKVSDDNGSAVASDVVEGLQWILDNKATYNIRVVNMSFNSSVMQSYNVDPLDAAVEVLWFNKVVVVVSSGNDGKNALYPPANDPFVITVGATDDRGTADTKDDVQAPFSGWGTSTDGFSKPDISAPGVNIVSLLASPIETLAVAHPDHVVLPNTVGIPYFRMSGTSMAAPIVAGASALLLQREPNLNPDQVKFRLMDKAHNVGGKGSGTAEVEINATVSSTNTQNANTGRPASALLQTGATPVNWDSVNWNSVNWNSVNWNSVNWNSVNWNSDWWENH